MYCRKCGARIAEGTSFCTACGERVAPLTVSQQGAFNAAAVPGDPVVQASQPVQNTVTGETADTAGAAGMAGAETTNVTNAAEAESRGPAEAARPMPAYTAPPVHQAQTPILPPVIAVPEKEKVKTDFGKGALAFCLVIIGILAVSTGVFAGLYFSLL